MSPEFATEEPTADKPAIGSPRWYATQLDYYLRGLTRAINMLGENDGVSRVERKLVCNARQACTICHRPKCFDTTHAKRTEYDLVTGITGPFSGETYPDAKLIWFYLRDSLAWAIEEFQAGRPLYAFRGLLQAQGYAGKLDGMKQAPHDVLSSDAIGTLRNAIESVIGTKEGY